MLSQLIRDPTRVTLTSCSLIDVIFASEHINISLSGVIQKCISDHFGVYAVVSSNIPSSSSGTNVISTRNLNNFNRDTFTSKIVNSDTFNTLNNICDVELAWNIWKKEYL